MSKLINWQFWYFKKFIRNQNSNFWLYRIDENYHFDTFEKNCLDWKNYITPNFQFSFSSNLRDFQIITSQFFVTKFTFIWHPLSKSLQHIKMTVLEHCHTKMVKIWLLIFRNALFFCSVVRVCLELQSAASASFWKRMIFVVPCRMIPHALL